MSKKQNFEIHLNALKKSVEALDSEQLGLEESIKVFEEGMKHAQKCDNLLKAAEAKMEALTQKHGLDDSE